MSFKNKKWKINTAAQVYLLSKGKVYTQNISSMSSARIKEDTCIENPPHAHRKNDAEMVIQQYNCDFVLATVSLESSD